jgi:hypothetical protein
MMIEEMNRRGIQGFQDGPNRLQISILRCGAGAQALKKKVAGSSAEWQDYASCQPGS